MILATAYSDVIFILADAAREAGSPAAEQAIDANARVVVYGTETPNTLDREEALVSGRRHAHNLGLSSLSELVEQIHNILWHVAEEGTPSAATFLLSILRLAAKDIHAEEDEQNRLILHAILSAAGVPAALVKDKLTVVREPNRNNAQGPGQSERNESGSTTTEPPASVVGLKSSANSESDLGKAGES